MINLLKNGLFNTLLASSPLREKQQKTIRKKLNTKSSKKIFTSSNSQSIEIFETDLYKKKVIFFPGWLGHKDSKYLIPLAHLLHSNKFDIIRIHPLDHGDTEYLNKDFFRATDIQTLIEVVEFIGKKYKNSEIHLIGFSLGGNISLRISASDSINFLKSTIVLSPVIDPKISMQAMDNTSWVLRKYFTNKWHKSLKRKIEFHKIANMEEVLK
jgi:predicted alpha/beta-fold hydrolase